MLNRFRFDIQKLIYLDLNESINVTRCSAYLLHMFIIIYDTERSQVHYQHPFGRKVDREGKKLTHSRCKFPFPSIILRQFLKC